MKDEKYICFAQGVEQFDYQGKSLGIGNDRALYYSKSIGKGRIYRSSYPTPPDNPKNDFVLFHFKEENDSLSMCIKINAAYNDVFKPHQIL